MALSRWHRWNLETETAPSMTIILADPKVIGSRLGNEHGGSFSNTGGQPVTRCHLSSAGIHFPPRPYRLRENSFLNHAVWLLLASSIMNFGCCPHHQRNTKVYFGAKNVRSTYSCERSKPRSHQNATSKYEMEHVYVCIIKYVTKLSESNLSIMPCSTM